MRVHKAFCLVTLGLACLAPSFAEPLSADQSDPATSRYFFSPSAFTLKAGQTNFTQLELFYSQVSFGLTDNLSLQAGSILPYLLAPEPVVNFQSAAKWGAPVLPGLNLAAGVFLFELATGTDSGGIVVPFGTVTVGDKENNASLNLSPIYSFGIRGLAPLEVTVVSLSGKLRMAKGVSLLTENWFFWKPGGTAPYPLFSLGARFNGTRLSADVGLATNKAFFLPLPWVNFSYAF